MSLCINFLRSCDFAILARLNWFLSQVVVINFDSLLDMYVSYETRAKLHVWLKQSPSSSSPPQWNERGTIAGDPDGIGHACLVVNITWLKQSLYVYYKGRCNNSETWGGRCGVAAGRCWSICSLQISPMLFTLTMLIS